MGCLEEPSKEDLRIVADRMEKSGLSLIGSKAGGMVDLAFCCAVFCRAARRSGWAVNFDKLVKDWGEWRGVDPAPLLAALPHFAVGRKRSAREWIMFTWGVI